MIGRLAALGFVGGVTAAHGLADLPHPAWAVLAAAPAAGLWLALTLARRRRRDLPGGRPLSALAANALGGALVWLAACGGFAWTVALAQHRLADVLAHINVDRVTRVDLRIVGLPRLDPDRRRFEAEVLSARPEGAPRRILVTWGAPGWRGPYASPAEPAHAFPLLAPGQVWRMALVTRPVHAALNPHAFDAERHAFAHGTRATGTVRGTPRLLRDDPWV